MINHMRNFLQMLKKTIIAVLSVYWLLMVITPISTAFAETNTVSSTVTGTTTVDKTPSTASAPNVMVNNQDVCSTGVSASVQTQVLGIAGGTTIRDLNCERLKLSKALYGMGMKVDLQSRCFVKMQECSMLWKWI